MTKQLIFDCEVFVNLFTATFISPTNAEEKYIFYVGLDKTNYQDLLEFLKEEHIFITYNGISYDLPILRFIQQYKGSNLNADLYKLSQKLVNDDFRSDRTILSLRYPKYGATWESLGFNFDTIDLMKIIAGDKLGISLKQIAINLRFPRIQDLPLAYDAQVGVHQLDLVLSYNMNDCLITKALYEKLEPERILRDELSILYNADLRSASDSKMANIIFETIYASELHISIKDIRDKRTPREKVLLGECILPFVEFESPELQDLLERIKSSFVYSFNEFRYSEKLYFAKCEFSLGIGGLHTNDAPGVFTSDENYLLQDADVASYYPNLIINGKFFPEHLGEDFINVLKIITKERLKAKKEKYTAKANGLKITANASFGKLGSPTFWFYDPKQMLSTTLNGQLLLLMLIEKLHLAGIRTISANTDGIVCQIDRTLLDSYYKICKEWEELTHLELEFTPYKKYVRRDVNSYVTIKENGDTKEKGAFLKELDLKKAYHMPVVARALYEYFVNGIPVKKTLAACHDILDFCISQKSAPTFQIELHKGKDIERLQKTNRFYISKKGGALFKREPGGRLTGLYAGKQVGILNNYDASVPFKSYAVDLTFYEQEVYKVIDLIEPPQMSLFDMQTMDYGTKTHMEAENATEAAERDMLDFRELNKLGSKQFAKQIEETVKNGQTIEHISPRYTFVNSFDYKTRKLSLYCLRKGTVQQVFVGKDAYNDFPVRGGEIIFCTKFQKRKDEFWLMEYTWVTKFEKEEEKLI
jgi:hypothetical protein